MFLASCGTDIKLHAHSNYEIKHVYEPARGVTTIRTISWSKDGQLLVAVPQKGHAEIAALKDDTFRKIHSIHNFEHPTAAVFQRNYKRNLAIGSSSGTVAIYDLKGKTFRKTLQTQVNSAVTHLDFCSKDTHLAVGFDNGQIGLYGLSTNTQLSTINVSNESPTVSALRFHSTNRSLLGAANDDGVVIVWDIHANRKRINIKHAHSAPCTGVAFSPINENLMTSVGYDCTFNCYDMSTGTRVVSKLLEQPLSYHDIMYTGNIVAVASKKGLIYVLDLRKYDKLLATITAHSSDVRSVLYQPNDPTTNVHEDIALTSEDSATEITIPAINQPSNIDSFLIQMLESPNTANKTEQSIQELEPGAGDSFLQALGISNAKCKTPDLTEVLESSIHKMSSAVDKKKWIGDHYPPQNFETHQKTSTPVSGQFLQTEIVEVTESPIIPKKSDKILQCCMNTEKSLHSEEIIKIINDAVETNTEAVLNSLRFEVSELLDILRSEFLQTKICIAKQFVFQEERIDLMEKRLSSKYNEELEKLRKENEALKLKLTNKHLDSAEY